MSSLIGFFCCAPGVGPRELIVIAALGFFIVALPIWTWYRNNKIHDDRDKHRRPPP